MVKFYPYPLGLPKGTVRAAITLSFFFTTLYFLLVDKLVPTSLANTILIVVSFYFSFNRTYVPLDKKVDSQTETKITRLDGQTAFNLPRRTVRVALFTGLALVTLKFLIQSSVIYDTIPRFIIDALLIMTGYLIGLIYQKISAKIPHGESTILTSLFYHGKALLVLSMSIMACGLYLMELNIEYYIFIFATNGVVGFYFGSRS